MNIRDRLSSFGFAWADFLPELNIPLVFRHMEEADDRVKAAKRALAEARAEHKRERNRTLARILELYTLEEIRAAQALAAQEGK